MRRTNWHHLSLPIVFDSPTLPEADCQFAVVSVPLIYRSCGYEASLICHLSCRIYRAPMEFVMRQSNLL
jgi:hypothetical protein